MSDLQIKFTRTGAELKLKSYGDFFGLKTFYITKKRDNQSFGVFNVLSCFDVDDICFLYKEKLSSKTISRLSRYVIRFDEIQKIATIDLFTDNTLFHFVLRKSSNHTLDKKKCDLYFAIFDKVLHEPLKFC
ncbi:hypothetical protein [Gluconobacter cerinus]|uniref:hypothetical protein n=1 Tax=Gluconobacter cerinus TaxID=38307 RepID=UPI001B8B12EE|nr:hypothetical protein [Gluconobacter cerinus]MBS0984519.1 hypothetical protein [Gluconobacter cerinus]